MESLLSVGIDIGTTTAQTVFSSLNVDNTADCFKAPSVSIVSKEILYRGAVHGTPMKSDTLLDADSIVRLIQSDYKDAGIEPAAVDTGAVIITGEAARKENAAAVADKLSRFAGEFVVATAGPDLEAIIAGKGSGASDHSRAGLNTANLDIGGGTSNVALFRAGEPVATGCLDIGGRMLRTAGGRIDYMSPAARRIAAWCGADVREGGGCDLTKLEQFADGLARILEQLFLLSPRTDVFRDVMTASSSDFMPAHPIQALTFSGGVSDIIYGNESDPFKYGDIGVILGRAISRSRLMDLNVIRPGETIRATVVGAGTCSASISGSTIFFDAELLPLRNVPVLRLTSEEEQRIFTGEHDFLKKKLAWFMNQVGSSLVALAFTGETSPSYERIKTLAGALSAVAQGTTILIIERDMAKALGQALWQLNNKNLIVLDGIRTAAHDHIDIGRPLLGGLAVPVIVKTLIFG
ncbi:MAG: reactivating factor for ethanolamine ammonia lyase [Firmicutes bacterium ADurb.Bin182]|nr:MAG: reactivating factor for ethanolamine ammonia lyase [Firmicutes bacterium ADurb.Bin182]